MRLGIIAEFNPLHSGHRYLIEKAKEIGGEIVCVMSEFFTQRGEVAVVDGYSRAREAVLAGCDLVIALPYLGSVAYSDDFAKKSIEILNGAGVTHLIFGTEDTDIELFDEIYQKQKNFQQDSYKKLLKKGYNFAKINNELFGLKANNPNFTLAYSYYKAVKELAPHIELVPVKREGQKLNDKSLTAEKHLSATAIRKNLTSAEVKNYLSENMLKTLETSKCLSEEDFFNFLKYKIISQKREELANIYDISEGLENRIVEAALSAKNYEELVEKIATKRYSKKKIQRVLLHILTNTTKEDYKNYFPTKNFRVLATRASKTSLIRQINNRGQITLIPKLNSKNSFGFTQDIKVARIYNLIAQQEDIFKKNLLRIDD